MEVILRILFKLITYDAQIDNVELLHTQFTFSELREGLDGYNYKLQLQIL